MIRSLIFGTANVQKRCMGKVLHSTLRARNMIHKSHVLAQDRIAQVRVYIIIVAEYGKGIVFLETQFYNNV
jgi:hypothetical protein